MLASESPIANNTNKKRKKAEIERLVLYIAQKLYQTKPQVRSYGDNIGVWQLTFAGDRDDRVLKIGTDNPRNLLREQAISEKLYRLDLAVPEIEFTQRDLANIWFPFTVMPKVTDTNLKDASLEDLPYAMKSFYQSGEFLALLSRISPEEIELQPPLNFMPRYLEEKDGGFANNDRRRWQRIFDRLREWELLSPKIQDILLQAQEIIDRQDFPHLVHQDFVPRQILVDSDKFAVIDWESATVGRVYCDLGDFLAANRRYLRKKPNKLDYLQEFLAGFSQHRSLSDAEKREISLWEAYAHIRSAVGEAAQNKREKILRRLEFATEAIDTAN